MQVAAWWWLDGWAVVSDSRHNFQTAGFVDGQNVAGTALAAVIARPVQAHLAASAVVAFAFVNVQALSVVPIRL